MALSDPQSVTISAVPVSLPCTGSSLNEGRYTSDDGEVSLITKHDNGRRIRHHVELRKSDIVADPLAPSVNMPIGYTIRLTVDVPRQGVTAADALAHAKALVAWCTDANLTKIIGGQV